MSSLAVDKVKKKVAVSLADRTQLTGYIFLSAFSEIGVGAQSVLEALTGRELFLPFETPEGELSFINRRQIVWLSSLFEPEELTGRVPAETRGVTIFLKDGQRLRGHMVKAMPETKDRLSDWLNDLADFMVVRDQKREILINLDFIIRVA
ncbi:MAG: hypothetical protein AB1896_06595 [Thermodesulfobacteriota bacterium]